MRPHHRLIAALSTPAPHQDGTDPKKKPSLMQSIVKWYLTNHINRQFAGALRNGGHSVMCCFISCFTLIFVISILTQGAWDDQDCSPIPPSIPTASIATVCQ